MGKWQMGKPDTLYFKTMNTKLEAVEKQLDAAKCDRKEVKEIVRQEMDANYACRPSDDESKSLQTTQDGENVVQETVKKSMKEKRYKCPYFQSPRTRNKHKGREGDDSLFKGCVMRCAI